MRTKFEVGQKLYYFDPNEERIVSDEVSVVFADKTGTYYRFENVTLPESQVFSAELQCRNHYREIFL